MQVQQIDRADIVRRYTAGAQVGEIAFELGCRDSVIRDILKSEGVYTRRDWRSYTFNESFFERIDDEFKAYSLGFLYADGHNDRKANKVSIELKRDDAQIVRDIASALGFDGPLRHRTYGSRDPNFRGISAGIVLRSKKLSEDLDRHGCTHFKSDKVSLPNLAPDLMRHFIRGYLDGDGCIYRYPRGSWQVYWCGNPQFMSSLRDYMGEYLDTTMPKLNVRSEKVAEVRINRAELISRVYDFLYKDARIYLARKHELLAQAVETYREALELKQVTH